ncbi:hypothetical protein NDU88_005290 [Pleurodeles waltl]|uniref:Myelin basic protein n=1 Tax=Pleurodeles waltl TaxID=8319 RepID=A0AAV7TAK0_PLEWA|nr:hypothetical protein NDU88_005290 [Pleurodeles waltl]
MIVHFWAVVWALQRLGFIPKSQPRDRRVEDCDSPSTSTKAKSRTPSPNPATSSKAPGAWYFSSLVGRDDGGRGAQKEDKRPRSDSLRAAPAPDAKSRFLGALQSSGTKKEDHPGASGTKRRTDDVFLFLE